MRAGNLGLYSSSSCTCDSRDNLHRELLRYMHEEYDRHEAIRPPLAERLEKRVAASTATRLPGGREVNPGGAFKFAPAELQSAISEFWPDTEWDNAAAIAQLESGYDPFALNDTTRIQPCGTLLFTTVDGINIFAERSVGYFQINSCLFPTWEWQRLYNARHNAGTAHMLWDQAMQSWNPWYFSAKALGLLG